MTADVFLPRASHASMGEGDRERSEAVEGESHKAMEDVNSSASQLRPPPSRLATLGSTTLAHLASLDGGGNARAGAGEERTTHVRHSA